MLNLLANDGSLARCTRGRLQRGGQGGERLYAVVLLLVETPQSIHHIRYGRHRGRGVSRGEGTATGPSAHDRCGGGFFDPGDAPTAVVAEPGGGKRRGGARR